MPEIVPLVRPSFPDRFVARWRAATQESNQFSNFGPLWHEASRLLEELTGRIALPVSSGTEAVAIAIQAHGFTKPAVYFEAFTFTATQIAAQRCDPHAVAIRTDAVPTEQDDVVVTVRTVPFGSSRAFPRHRDENMVIDAAGAFGGDFFKSYPADAFIACSFHATKNFPIGEGGCVFLPAGATWARRAAVAAMNFGFDPDRKVLPGYATNAKLDELRCAVLLEQLDRREFFAVRSERIARQSQVVALAGVGAWLPYKPGEAQSLVVVAHHEPDRLVAHLAAAGFIARRVYHPHVCSALLTYDELRLVALPSDCTAAELDQMIETMKGIA